MSAPAAMEPDTSAATSSEKDSTVITPDRNTPAGAESERVHVSGATARQRCTAAAVGQHRKTAAAAAEQERQPNVRHKQQDACACWHIGLPNSTQTSMQRTCSHSQAHQRPQASHTERCRCAGRAHQPREGEAQRSGQRLRQHT